MSMPLGLSLGLESWESLWPGHGEPVTLLHISHAAVVSISFKPPHSLKVASCIFSYPLGGQPLGLSWQPCDCCSVSSSRLWLLSKQLRPFEKHCRQDLDSSSSLPSGQRLSFDIALPRCRTGGMLMDGDLSSPSAGTQEIPEPQAPLLSSFQICCHYFIIVLISWLTTLHCQLINDGNVDSRGRK